MPRREAIRAAALMPSGDPALARSVGALVGLAVGDALGAPVEGLPRDSYPPIVELGSGEGTDDTGMAICLAESLLERGFLDQADLLRRFVLWYRAGGRGLSTTTRAVLEAFESTERLDVAHGAANAGNGCIMRLAPVAIRYRGDRRAAREAAEAQARVTHGAEEAIAASACLADILVAGLATGDFEAMAEAAAAVRHSSLAGIAALDWRAKPRDGISSAPRAVDTLEAALWCVAQNESFEAAVLAAVHLGGDTDTIGAVTGQLAGALYGIAAIPARWVERLEAAPRLVELAIRLHGAGLEPALSRTTPETLATGPGSCES